MLTYTGIIYRVESASTVIVRWRQYVIDAIMCEVFRVAFLLSERLEHTCMPTVQCSIYHWLSTWCNAKQQQTGAEAKEKRRYMTVATEMKYNLWF